jgi:hypothetical protein
VIIFEPQEVESPCFVCITLIVEWLFKSLKESTNIKIELDSGLQDADLVKRQSLDHGPILINGQNLCPHPRLLMYILMDHIVDIRDVSNEDMITFDSICLLSWKYLVIRLSNKPLLYSAFTPISEDTPLQQSRIGGLHPGSLAPNMERPVWRSQIGMTESIDWKSWLNES